MDGHTICLLNRMEMRQSHRDESLLDCYEKQHFSNSDALTFTCDKSLPFPLEVNAVVFRLLFI